MDLRLVVYIIVIRSHVFLLVLMEETQNLYNGAAVCIRIRKSQQNTRSKVTGIKTSRLSDIRKNSTNVPAAVFSGTSGSHPLQDGHSPELQRPQD